MTTHPPGYVEYKEALSPKGKYGQWLRGKPIVTVVDGNIFMHAGISPANPPAKIEDLNVQTKDEIRRLDQFLDRLIGLKLATREFTLQEILQVASSEIGLANARIAAAKAEGKEPDRGKLNIPLLMEAQEIMKIDTWLVDQSGRRAVVSRAVDGEGRSGRRTVRRAAGEYGAKRFVTGHTPQQSRSITVRYGGRAILIDTGMLTSYLQRTRVSARDQRRQAHGDLRRRESSRFSKPLHRFAQPLFEPHDRLVAEQLLGFRNVGL